MTNAKDEYAHGLLAANNLNCDFFAGLAFASLHHSGADDIREHTFSQRGEHLLQAAIKLLSENYLIVSFGV